MSRLTWDDLLIQEITPEQFRDWLSPWTGVVTRRVAPAFMSKFGFWFLRRSKKFRWSRVIAVHEGDAHMGPKGGPPFQLIYLRILGEKKDETFKFGLHLPDERRHWVIALIGWQAQSTCNSPFLRLK